jgi:hypothetical protein
MEKKEKEMDEEGGERENESKKESRPSAPLPHTYPTTILQIINIISLL